MERPARGAPIVPSLRLDRRVPSFHYLLQRVVPIRSTWPRPELEHSVGVETDVCWGAADHTTARAEPGRHAAASVSCANAQAQPRPPLNSSLLELPGTVFNTVGSVDVGLIWCAETLLFLPFRYGWVLRFRPAPNINLVLPHVQQLFGKLRCELLHVSINIEVLQTRLSA